MIKFKQTESRMTVARGWAEERRGLVFNGYRVSVMQDEKNRVLEVDVDGGYSGTTMWTYLMPLNCTFKND